MWLLDVNLPNGLIALLRKLGIDAKTSIEMGWRNLSNGDLASAANQKGFKVILTRDRVFGESAGKALKNFPDLAVVILLIPQSRQLVYLKEFERCWTRSPIAPKAGSVIEWP